MASDSYYDWSNHWYSSEENSSMDRTRRTSFVPELIHKAPDPDTIVTYFGFEPNDEIRHQRKMFSVENTFQLEPPKKFCPDLVSGIIEKVLHNTLHDKQYNHAECASLTKTVADQLKNKMKELNFKRYKIVTNVLLGEQKDQSIRVGSRFLWDNERDNYASANFINRSLFAIGIVYATYFE